MTLRSSTTAGLGLLGLALLAACGGGGGSTVTPATTCQDPLAGRPATSHFATDLLPVLQTTCGGGAATQSCHGTLSVPAGKFSFYTDGVSRTALQVHADLVNVVPANAPTGQGWMRVKPGDPSRSWLIEKVSTDQPGGLGYGARMPAGAPSLCSASITTLRTWIQNGAPY